MGLLEGTLHILLLVGLPAVTLWIAFRVFRSGRRAGRPLTALLSAVTLALVAVPIWYAGVLASVIVGCAAHRDDPNCETAGTDFLAGMFAKVLPHDRDERADQPAEMLRR